MWETCYQRLQQWVWAGVLDNDQSANPDARAGCNRDRVSNKQMTHTRSSANCVAPRLKGFLRSKLALATMLVVPIACVNDGIEPLDVNGATQVLLTDGPFPYSRVAKVELWIVSVSGSIAADTSAAGSFVTLAQPNRRFDVLALQAGATTELGSARLTSGAIKSLRMVIDTDSSRITLKDGRVLTSRSTPGIQWQSSAGRPSLNAFVHEQMVVPDSGAVIVIDFDVGQSFIPVQELDAGSTDSSFIFSPWMRAVDRARTGSITGVVKGPAGEAIADASVRLYMGNVADAENTMPTLGTGKTDATGAFRLSYLTPSSRWAPRVYMVAVDPPSGSSLGRSLTRNVNVVVGQVTALGTITLR